MDQIKEFLLVTTPTARQFDGIWEVEWALEGEIFEIKKTKFKGVLLVKCKNARKAAEMLRDYETSAIHRVLPFDRYINTDMNLITVEATDVAAPKIFKSDTFAVRCKKRGKAKKTTSCLSPDGSHHELHVHSTMYLTEYFSLYS